jgi:seryl-tRNA synthetase
MLDINFVKKNLEIVKSAVVNKNLTVDVDKLILLDDEKKKIQQQIDEIGAKRNELVRQAKGEKPSQEAINIGKKLKEDLTELEKSFKSIDDEFTVILLQLPNVPTPDTPTGKDESENKIIGKFGEIAQMNFKPKEHWEIAENLGLLDSERATKISGSRFIYMKGDIVLLQYALIQQVLDILTDKTALEKIIADFNLSTSAKPFVPVIPPVIVRSEVMQRMARLEPKEERYHIEIDNMYLVGSAEHALGPMFMDETLQEENLPLRFVGVSSAFRREAGSYGKDIKGMIRVHQFEKCEMESFSTPENSLEEHKLFIAIQETLMRSLNIPYQLVLKCTGDMGTPDARAVDIEAWFPGQNKYRETHTSDYMTDFQSRRLKTKIRMKSGGTEFVHMNDGTAFAGRTIAAIIENYQQADGSVVVPEVLRKYLGGKEVVKAV